MSTENCCSRSLLSSISNKPEMVNLTTTVEKSAVVPIQVLAKGATAIEHNLNKFPKPVVFDELGRYIEVAYRYTGKNKIIIESSSPIKGTVYLS